MFIKQHQSINSDFLTIFVTVFLANQKEMKIAQPCAVTISRNGQAQSVQNTKASLKAIVDIMIYWNIEFISWMYHKTKR